MKKALMKKAPMKTAPTKKGPMMQRIPAGYVLFAVGRGRGVKTEEDAYEASEWFCKEGWTPTLRGAVTFSAEEDAWASLLVMRSEGANISEEQERGLRKSHVAVWRPEFAQGKPWGTMSYVANYERIWLPEQIPSEQRRRLAVACHRMQAESWLADGMKIEKALKNPLDRKKSRTLDRKKSRTLADKKEKMKKKERFQKIANAQKIKRAMQKEKKEKKFLDNQRRRKKKALDAGGEHVPWARSLAKVSQIASAASSEAKDAEDRANKVSDAQILEMKFKRFPVLVPDGSRSCGHALA